MEVEVIKGYTDSDTRVRHEPLQVLKYSEKRGKFLVLKGFVKEIKKSFEDKLELNKK
jgi:hypothetical protein|tara:strand:- start:174 stop:344 length:171 start_codon:yes stop_codon:yes gene_type:complete